MESFSDIVKGIAKFLSIHSQKTAIEPGYLAMQFNSVVSTKEVVMELWKKLGYKIIGRIPIGFRHSKLDFVDYLIIKEDNGVKACIVN